MVLMLMVATLVASPGPSLFDGQGYRRAQYRAVVTGAPPGIKSLSDREAATLHDRRAAIFVDVFPADGGRRDAASGRWHLAEERRSIPGAHWFPEAGRAPLDPVIASWFRSGIMALRKTRPLAPLVIYCRADCWMSWNAARRLHEWGVRNVRWYGAGTDGWIELGRPLAVVRPFGEARH